MSAVLNPNAKYVYDEKKKAYIRTEPFHIANGPEQEVTQEVPYSKYYWETAEDKDSSSSKQKKGWCC